MNKRTNANTGRQKVSVRVTSRQLARLDAIARVEATGKVNPPDRSDIFRECLEEGIERKMKKLPPAQRQLVEKAGAAA
jgi:hypothetical protein